MRQFETRNYADTWPASTDIIQAHLPSGRRFELYMPTMLTLDDREYLRLLLDLVLSKPDEQEVT